MPKVIIDFSYKNYINNIIKNNIKIRINQFRKDFIKFNWINTENLIEIEGGEYTKGINQIIQSELSRRRNYINMFSYPN